MPQGAYTVTIRDHSGETSTTQWNTPQLSAANIDDYGATLSTALMTAIDPLIMGNVARHSLQANSVFVSAAKPGDKNAQRERKWYVPYTDTVTGISGHFEIPTADAALLIANTDLLDTSLAAWDTFRDLVEANFVSNVGNPIELGQPQLVGRNL